MLFRVENGVKKTITYDVVKIRAGEIADPVLVSDDVVVVKRNPSRVASGTRCSETC
jgi:protein involved in polysaccharide export with SLBB domain